MINNDDIILQDEFDYVLDKYINKPLNNAVLLSIKSELLILIGRLVADGRIRNKYDIDVKSNYSIIDITVTNIDTNHYIHITSDKESSSYYYDMLLEQMKSEYGDKLGTFLTNRFAKMIRLVNDSCIDNYRVCKVGDVESEDKYQKQLEDGCCGFIDREFHFDNDIYRIGFNYGH